LGELLRGCRAPKKGSPIGAFSQRQKIVIPLTIGMGSDVFAVLAVDDADIGSFTIHQRKERVRMLFNRLDYLLASPSPTGTAKMSDSLMGIVSWLFIDAGNLHVCHRDSPFKKVNLVRVIYFYAVTGGELFLEPPFSSNTICRLTLWAGKFYPLILFAAFLLLEEAYRLCHLGSR
jgi:hypothetical protein